MFTIIWLLVWLLNSCPDLSMWNAWAVSVLVCIAIDILT